MCIYIYIRITQTGAGLELPEITLVCFIHQAITLIDYLKSDVYCLTLHAVSFHNFKSHNFKLRVSNPKSKHVAYLSVLSQISNCQGLGRKNNHEI